MKQVLGLVSFIIVILVLFGISTAAIRMVRWIVRPLESLARPRQSSIQFTVLDVLMLFAMLQCTVGTVHYLATTGVEPGSAAAHDAVTSAYAWDAIAAVYFVLCWCGGMTMASRAGINRWWHRVIILGFVAPGTTIGVPLTISLAISLTVFVDRGELESGMAMLGMLCLALGVIGLCRALASWLAAKYPPTSRRARPTQRSRQQFARRRWRNKK